MKKIETTLCMIYKHPNVLLGMKKRGFGAGRWNGFGGKIKEGETMEESIKRETKEEAEIEILDLQKVGIINFEFQNGDIPFEVNFFQAKSFKGEPTESEEMKPKWFNINEIPFDQMWPDDRYWMPMFLAGKKFKGRFLFNQPSTPELTSTILEKELEEVEEI